LLAEHVAAHRRHPAPHQAVLGHTRLDASLASDPLMIFVTEIDGFLFSYGAIADGQRLDFTYFWGGRTSCKRSFLLEHGVFNRLFTFGCEDIDLGARLSSHNLEVFYNRRAVTSMLRGMDVKAFCHRVWRQGRSQWTFSRLHADLRARQWSEVDEAFAADWTLGRYQRALKSASDLDRLARIRLKRALPLRGDEESLLQAGYRKAFRLAKYGGILEAAREDGAGPPTASAPPAPE
ncbi:MAG TPA: hypothetical protein VGJ29_09910, partial [Vicinamibacterales bacterium]